MIHVLYTVAMIGLGYGLCALVASIRRDRQSLNRSNSNGNSELFV